MTDAKKPAILIIGETTPRMDDAFDAAFTCHRMKDSGDMDSFPAGEIDSIEGVALSATGNLPAELMARLANLKIIACNSVGYDSVDAAGAAARGIIVTHTPDVLNAEVSTTAILLLGACYRRMIPDYNYILAGRWESEGAAPLTRSIDGIKVGILGYGRIGQAIARKLEAFDCDISYHARNKRAESPHRYYDNLVAMAKDVRALIVITPGGKATEKLVGREVLDALGPEGCLVNVARGSVVDEDALVAALTEGRLGYAGLDVFVNEPQVPRALFDMENVVLLPHVGSATVETRQAMGDLAVENLVRFFGEGKVKTPIPECKHLA